MVTIYHNPRCSKSRQTLQLLEDNGATPEVVLYLKNTPDKATLAAIQKSLGVDVRGMMRTKEAEYKEQNLANDTLSDSDLLDAMIKTPKLIERPIVVKGKKAAIGRPPESVLDIL
jgi:arsenate reductase